MEKKKKVIIIGGGVSGMSAGIYLLDNGYDCEIYEKHSIAGGECTGWNRKGTYIDGCAHWIVGTNRKSDLYPLWEHVGALDENSVIHDTEYFVKHNINGETFTFYADLDKLKEEMLRVAPKDKRQIQRFINGIRNYQKIRVPTVKPVDLMGVFEIIGYGLKMLPVVPRLLYYMHISVEDYGMKFKSPILREAFSRTIEKEYNVHSLFYIMKSLSLKDAGMVEGGSRNFAFRIRDTFKRKGGIFHFNSPVDEIVIDSGIAKGIITKGEFKEADYVISACDAYHTMHGLLKTKYYDRYFETKFYDRNKSPLSTSIQVSLKINKKIENAPKMVSINLNKPFNLGKRCVYFATIRNHSFDETLYKDSTVYTSLIPVYDDVYEMLKKMDKIEYQNWKFDLGKKIEEEVRLYYGLDYKDIELLDVTTPLTYERYCNAYRGSYMSFITTVHVKELMRKGTIKGISNFFIAGQWIMSPGGLPIALFSGKHAAYRICKADKKKFVDYDDVSHVGIFDIIKIRKMS